MAEAGSTEHETQQFAEGLDSYLLHGRATLGNEIAIGQALAWIARHAASAYDPSRAQLILIGVAMTISPTSTPNEIAAVVARLATANYGGDEDHAV